MTNQLRSNAEPLTPAPRRELRWVAIATAVALVASVLAVVSLQSSASGQRQTPPSFVTAAGDEVILGDDTYQVRLAGQGVSRSLPVAEGVWFGGRNLKAAPEPSRASAERSRGGQGNQGGEESQVSPAQLWLVQFSTVPLPAYTQELTAMGARVGPYIPEHTHLVRMDPSLVASVRDLPFVQWVGAYTSDLKTVEPTTSALTTSPDTTAGFRVRLFDDGADTRSDVTNAIAAAGGTIDPNTSPDHHTLLVAMTFGVAASLLEHDGVQFLEQVTAAENDTLLERIVGGASRLENVYGYTGTDVGVHVFDDGLLTNHEQFVGADIQVESNAPTITPASSSHGTQATSIIVGTGANNAGTRGLAPDARVTFSSRLPLVNTPFVTGRDRLQLAAQMVDPAQQYRAVVSVSPWGSALGNAYTVASADLDNAVFVTDLLTVQSHGNAADTDPTPRFRPQSSAKNVVSVGAVSMRGTPDYSDDLYRNTALTTASGIAAWGSRGPAADGRIKPDLFFANDGVAAADYMNVGSTSDYKNFLGTSASSTATAGYFALLYEMWADGVFTGTQGLNRDVFDSRMRMATAKAIAINTAVGYDFQGTGADKSRFHQGWGHISLGDAADLALAGNIPILIDETDVLEPFGTTTYQVGVTSDSDCFFRTTMVYTDPAGTPGASRDRVNDLSLRLTSPSGVTYWGNNGLTLSNQSTANGASNRLDTVENVFLKNPEAGVWTITVFADEVIEDGHPETVALDADYALISSGDCVGPPGPQPGSITGSLWRDDNGDGAEGTSEPGLEAVQLQLLDSNGTIILSTASDSDGNYSFPNVPPGTYTLLVVGTTLPTSAGATTDPDGIATENRAVVTVSPETVTPADFGWQIQTVAVGNRVFEDTNFNGVLDAGETGIGGSITVALQDSTGATVRTTQTDADGWFLFDRLQPGTYRLAIPRFEILAGGQASGFDSTIGDANPNNNQDNDDNGAMYSGIGLRTQDITLSLGGEPTGEAIGPLQPSTPDVNSNLTVDIGLFPSRD